MFSKDASFQIALDSAPEELRASFKDQSLDQPGVLVAYIEDVLCEGFGTGIGTAAAAVFGTSIAIADIVPISSSGFSSTLPLSLSPAPFSPLVDESSSSSVTPVVGKRVRSKAKKSGDGVSTVEKGLDCVVVKRESVEVSRGDVEVMGKSPVGPDVVVDSEFDAVSLGLESSDSFKVVASTAQSAEIPRFHGFSQNLNSCGVPARLKTSELRGHQMPKILNAERSSNAS